MDKKFESELAERIEPLSKTAEILVAEIPAAWTRYIEGAITISEFNIVLANLMSVANEAAFLRDQLSYERSK